MKQRAWLIGGNSDKFDHVRCFLETGICYWYMQNCKFNLGDIVYVYIKEERRVMFKTIVEDINVKDSNPRKYHRKKYEPSDKCMKLSLISVYYDNFLGIDCLKEHGYKNNSLQKHNYSNKVLINYIESCFDENKSTGCKDETWVEARKRQELITIYERASDARRQFLEQQEKPYKCSVCGMDFESTYGERGKNFIHVHHLDPLSSNTGERDTRFVDLAMVCPNCHAMLHKGNKLLKPQQLKEIVEDNKKKK